MTSADPDSGLATAIAHAAARDDPSLPIDAGRELALGALAELRRSPSATPGTLARAVLDQHRDTDVSWANHIARLTLLLIAHN